MLSTLADAFMEENPDVKVNVTPVAWGQAVAKLQTAIAGGTDAGRQPDGHRHDGPVRGDRRLRARAGETSTRATFFESAWNTNVVDGAASGVPWYVETRLLYYRKDIAEKAGITAPPATWDDLKAMAKAMKEKGGAEVGHLARHQELAGVPAVPVVERRRRRRREAASSRSTARRPSRP